MNHFVIRHIFWETIDLKKLRLILEYVHCYTRACIDSVDIYLVTLDDFFTLNCQLVDIQVCANDKKIYLCVIQT